MHEIARQVQESSRIAGEAVKQAREDRCAHRGAVEGGRPHRRRGEADHGGRRADQSARAQCHDRGGARRRGRPRLCGRRLGSEGSSPRRPPRRPTRSAARSPRCSRPPASSVAAIKEISGTIGRISQHRATIAAAVEEQGAATQEIARNVHQAANGTAAGRRPTSPTSTAARARPAPRRRRCSTSAQSLSRESGSLSKEVERFVSMVRAA